jgi:hypothetical protein
LAVAVSGRIATTVAGCHSAVGEDEERSVTVIPLFEPGIAVVVIPANLPKAGLVVIQQPQPANPLGALPEVQVGNDHAGPPPVLARQRLSVDLPNHPRAPTGHVRQGDVGGVAV